MYYFKNLNRVALQTPILEWRNLKLSVLERTWLFMLCKTGVISLTENRTMSRLQHEKKGSFIKPSAYSFKSLAISMPKVMSAVRGRFGLGVAF